MWDVINHNNLGKFDHDRTLSSRTLESWFILGKSSPSMAELFRLVKYYNLPRIMSSPHSHLSEFQSKHSAAFYVLSPYNSGIDHSVSHCVMRFLEMFYQHHSVIVEIKHDTVIEHLVDGVFFFPFLRVDMDINRIRIRRVPLRLDCHDVNVGYFCWTTSVEFYT